MPTVWQPSGTLLYNILLRAHCINVSSPFALQTCALDIDCGIGGACVGVFKLPSGIPYEYNANDVQTCSEFNGSHTVCTVCSMQVSNENVCVCLSFQLMLPAWQRLCWKE